MSAPTNDSLSSDSRAHRGVSNGMPQCTDPDCWCFDPCQNKEHPAHKAAGTKPPVTSKASNVLKMWADELRRATTITYSSNDVSSLNQTLDTVCDRVTQVIMEMDRHSPETLAGGCLSYWRRHENRCVRPRDHAGECYYVTPGRAIMENMDFKPPLPLVTDRMQGVDCPDCEDETPHQHAQKASDGLRHVHISGICAPGCPKCAALKEER